MILSGIIVFLAGCSATEAKEQPVEQEIKVHPHSGTEDEKNAEIAVEYVNRSNPHETSIKEPIQRPVQPNNGTVIENDVKEEFLDEF